jgi:mitotic spindle assembly checkpoint protein MAD2
MHAEWLAKGLLKQMVLVVTEAGTKEVLERWTFDIDTNKDVLAGSG